MTIRSTVLCAALAALVPAAASAQVAEKDGLLSLKVSYADLDPGTPAGARTLLIRLRRAAEAVCTTAEEETGKTELQRYVDERACFTKAVTDSVRRVAAPELDRLAGLPAASATIKLAKR